MARPPLHGTRKTTRSVVARLLGVSTSTVSNLVRYGDLHTTIEKDGTHLFNLGEVEALARRRYSQGFKAKRFNEGEMAAAIFRLLEAGKSKAQIVIELLVEPEIVNKYYDEWKQTFSVRDAQKRRDEIERIKKKREQDEARELREHEKEIARLEKQIGKG